MTGRKPLHILSYNIHKGFALSRKYVLSAIRESIRKVHADIVFLQEVQGDHTDHKKLHAGFTGTQFEFLADEVWPHFAYGKNAVYTEGHHGNAILSKYPIQKWDNIDVSNNRFERRGILHGVIEYEGAPLDLLCVHLDLTESGRKAQIKRIIERIQKEIPDQHRLILAGDFNDWREQATPMFKEALSLNEVFMTVHGHHVRSFPAPFPFLRLDRVYIRGLRAETAIAHSDAPWSTLSDHCAIETTLHLV